MTLSDNLYILQEIIFNLSISILSIFLFDATDLKNILYLSSISILFTTIWKTEIYHVARIEAFVHVYKTWKNLYWSFIINFIKKFYEDQSIKKCDRLHAIYAILRYVYKHATCSIRILLARSNNGHVANAKVYVGDVVLLLRFCKTPTFLWRLSDLRYSAALRVLFE